MKQIESESWWEALYQAKADFAFGKEPSSFLKNHLHHLKKGETLDLAMGEGRNAVFLAKNGFKVTGIDFSQTAADRAKALAYENDVQLEIKKQSLDFFLIPLMKYDSIVVVDFHPGPTTMKNLVRGLAVQGTLLVDAYTKDQITKGTGFKPDTSECFGSNELLRELNGLKIIYYREMQAENGEYRVQCIGVKIGM